MAFGMIEVAGVQVDTDRIADHNLRVLVQRALGHIFSNELSAVVSNYVRDKANGADREAWAQEHTADLEKVRSEFIEGKLDQLYNGRLGERRGRAVTVDPFEAEVDRITTIEVKQILTSILKSAGVSRPSSVVAKYAEDEEAEFNLPDGSTVTLAGLKAKWIDSADVSGLFGKAGTQNRPRIERLARRNIEERKEKAGKKAEVAKAGLAGFGL